MAIIDYISTHQNFRQQGLAKLMMNHLINRVYNQGYDFWLGWLQHHKDIMFITN
ncbi:GNAT family N-acetyltransferase [Spiroplasma kunkelii]|uniref:GNAT family N-acetyltransferase n=1 Tax=Spiroplasma kunkelii TaxID=47834 RepID=UPI002E1406A1